jgi:hypothetical protein
MGACDFYNLYIGKEEPLQAFYNEVANAKHEHGHGGYTGTIAEKDRFIMIECPKGISPEVYVDDVMQNQSSRINDKYGPAGCIEYKRTYLKNLRVERGYRYNKGIRAYLFFGVASS